MEYVYAAMLIHSAGNAVSEDNVTDVLEAAGVEADDSRVKALLAALEGVDIDEAMSQAAAAPAAAAAAPSGESAPAEAAEEEAAEEEEEEEEEASDEEAAEGLGSLFG